MMDDQTYANMMESSQWNFAQKKFPLWEYPMKPIKNKNQRIPFNLFQTATVRNKAQLLFFFQIFFYIILHETMHNYISVRKSQRLVLKICTKVPERN